MATSTNTAGTADKSTDKSKDNPFSTFKIPTIDTAAAIESYKKNLEILGLINKMSIEVCSGVTKLQAAFFKQAIADLGSILSAKPSEASSTLSTITRDTIVRAIGNGKQISDLVTAANNDITAATAKRFRETIEEAKSALDKR